MPRRFLNLAKEPREAGPGIRSETSDDVHTIYIYDVIDDWFGISATAFRRELEAAGDKSIVLRINSPGGDVFEARAMMAAIAEHEGDISAKIDGLCASAATALTLPCSRVEIVDGGFYMIHQAWTIAFGNADDMRKTAGLLDKVDTALVNGYVQKSGMSEDDVRAAMAEETWYDADEAVEAGFCEAKIEIPVGSKEQGTKAQARKFDLSAFSNAPKALTEPPEEKEPDFVGSHSRMLARLKLYEHT